MTIKTLLPAAALGIACAFGTASAAPVTGGTTVVDVDIDLDIDVDIDVAPAGGATFEDDLLNVGITGGDFDQAALTGELFHAGGFSVTAVAQTVTITNLVINFAAGQVFGDVDAAGSVTTGAAVFDFDASELSSVTDLFNLDDPQLSIFATAEFSAIFVAIFAISIEGVAMGHVATNPMTDVDMDVVPLPGAAVLFGTVMAGAAARRRMKG